MIEEIRNNLVTEEAMVREFSALAQHLENASGEEARLLRGAIESIKTRIKILNATVGTMISTLSAAQKLPGKDSATGVERIHLNGAGFVAIRSSEKSAYLKELDIGENLLKKLKKHRVDSEVVQEYKKPNSYIQIANRFFLGLSQRWLAEGKFKGLNVDLRKANINILTAGYVSMIVLNTVLALLLGIGLTAFFLFFHVSTTLPFIQLFTGNYLLRLAKLSWIIVVPPLVTFGFSYLYPSIERKSAARMIESELPFVVIHMGSIAGSGVEPTQIFKIVGLSHDYKYTRGEIGKVINQVNVYGYDLITALKNVARLTSSPRLAELFNGLATTISSGGDLKTFFEKRAETLLLGYRLEREKFAKIAETFMDLYISVVIAAPMILLLLLVMISVSGVNIGGLQPSQMTTLILLVVAAVNVVFIWIIGLKQPSY